jgi:hypothetical protein
MMPAVGSLYLLFGLFVLVGGLRTARLLAARRRGDAALAARYRWSEERLSSWKYEPYSAGAISIHTLAVSVLAIAALGAAANPDVFDDTLVPNDATMTALLWFADGGCISLVGYLLGSLLAFPVSSLGRGSIAFAITDEGIVHGRTLLPWRWFSHFSVDHLGGILRFYSAFSPDLPSVVSKPASSASLGEIIDQVEGYLPAQPAPMSRRWYRSKRMLMPTMILVCLPLVGAGWLASHLPRAMALFGTALLMAILVSLGARVMTLFGFGALKIAADEASSPPSS